MLRDMILKNRSYRRFHQDVAIEIETLRELVDLARLSASASNTQPLKFVLSCDPQKNAQIFSCLAWAAYLKDWPGPAEGERPSAYIVILGDTQISQSFGVNHGIAAQSILLGATEKGLGGCMIGSIKKPELAQALNIPPHFEKLLVRTGTSSIGATARAGITSPSGRSRKSSSGNVKCLSICPDRIHSFWL
jgi:nitroreductase